jgi:hypothetical protein
MADIFLSYAKEDRDTARRLSMMLEQAGWTVWWDRRIPAGRTWHDVLEDALRDMRCMVVLWSSHSIESDWVKEEAEEARALKKLLPVLIEQVNAPVGFRAIQAADLTDWDGVNESFGSRQLIADLESLIGKPMPRQSLDVAPTPRESDTTRAAGAGQSTREAPPFDDSPVPYRRASRARHKPPWSVIGAGGAALALALGVFALWRNGEPLRYELATATVPTTSEAPPAPKVVKLGVSAPRRELKPAETMNLALHGVFSDGSENEISSAVDWSSSDSQVAAVDSQGRVTALQPGTAAITAIHGGITSSAWTVAVKAPEPPAPRLMTLAVNASKKELWPREKLILRATGNYSDGAKKSLSNGVSWVSSDTSVASVKAGGELEAWRAGKTEVVARLGDVTSPPVWLVVKEAPARTLAQPQERKGSDGVPSRIPSYAAVEKTSDTRSSAPYVNAEQVRTKVAFYINRARDYRVRGDYGAALAELSTARAADPANAEVRAEIEQTRRACLAEKSLGRGGLNCY